MIEEQQTRFVAAADWTDECRVDVRMRRKHMDLSASQAREFARELVDAAEQSERAADGAVRPVAASPFDIDWVSRASGIPSAVVQQVEQVAADLNATVLPARDRLSPDCRADKHPAGGWQDGAWDDATDTEVPCECSCHTAAKGTAA